MIFQANLPDSTILQVLDLLLLHREAHFFPFYKLFKKADNVLISFSNSKRVKTVSFGLAPAIFLYSCINTTPGIFQAIVILISLFIIICTCL